MNIFLLDAGGVFLFGFAIVAFILVAVLLESITMLLFKINSFGNCLWQSLVVNIASLIAGYLMLGIWDNTDLKSGEGANEFLPWIIMFFVTVLIEGLLISLFNKTKPKQKVWTAVFVMNLVTYLILFGFTSL